MKTLVASLLLCSACALVGCASDGPPPVAPPNPLDSAGNSPDATLTPPSTTAFGTPGSIQPPGYTTPGYTTPGYSTPTYTPPAYETPTYTAPSAGGYPAPPPADYTAPAPETPPSSGCGGGGGA